MVLSFLRFAWEAATMQIICSRIVAAWIIADIKLLEEY